MFYDQLEGQSEEDWEAHEIIAKTYDIIWNKIHINNTTYQLDRLLIKWNPYVTNGYWSLNLGYYFHNPTYYLGVATPKLELHHLILVCS